MRHLSAGFIASIQVLLVLLALPLILGALLQSMHLRAQRAWLIAQGMQQDHQLRAAGTITMRIAQKNQVLPELVLPSDLFGNMRIVSSTDETTLYKDGVIVLSHKRKLVH